MPTLEELQNKIDRLNEGESLAPNPRSNGVIVAPGSPQNAPGTTKVRKSNAGRPRVMTKDVIQKIEQVAAVGGSVEEMAMFADISAQTLYVYLKEHPEYSERIEALQEKPILKARNTIIKDLDTPETSKWYLERKRRKEFGPKLDIEQKVINLNIDL